MTTRVHIKKVDEDEQLIYGEVYAPVLWPDADGDIMLESEIKKIAHKFVSSGHIDKIDLMHDQTPTGSLVVESFIAREGDPDFIVGAWVIGVKINSDDLWAAVKSGEINGFSMEITASAVPVEIEIEIPEYLEGETSENAGHKHKYWAYFDDEGNFIGGETDEVMHDGKLHKHTLTRGTVTEKFEGHSHRFSVVDLIAGFKPVSMEQD